MDQQIIDRIHTHLRRARLKDALDEIYQYCRTYSRRHLEEVVSHISRLELLDGNHRTGLISFEDKFRMESQINTSVLKLLTILEEDGAIGWKSKMLQLEQAEQELAAERGRRLKAESRMVELEKNISKSFKQNIHKKVRDQINVKKIQLDIVAISRSASDEKNYALVFKENPGDRRLPIVIGASEAQAIAIAIENLNPNRPLTHDFFKTTIEEFGFSLKEVWIDGLTHGVFYSKAVFFNEYSLIEIDCRTSDAIALAVRFLTPIYTYDIIMDAAGVILEEEKE